MRLQNYFLFLVILCSMNVQLHDAQHSLDVFNVEYFDLGLQKTVLIQEINTTYLIVLFCNQDMFTDYANKLLPVYYYANHSQFDVLMLYGDGMYPLEKQYYDLIQNDSFTWYYGVIENPIVFKTVKKEINGQFPLIYVLNMTNHEIFKKYHGSNPDYEQLLIELDPSLESIISRLNDPKNKPKKVSCFLFIIPIISLIIIIKRRSKINEA